MPRGSFAKAANRALYGILERRLAELQDKVGIAVCCCNCSRQPKRSEKFSQIGDVSKGGQMFADSQNIKAMYQAVMDANVFVHVHNLCIAIICKHSVIPSCDVPDYIEMK